MAAHSITDKVSLTSGIVHSMKMCPTPFQQDPTNSMLATTNKLKNDSFSRMLFHGALNKPQREFRGIRNSNGYLRKALRTA